MPKLKTHKGAQSRFWVTGNGKFMRSKGNRRHLKAHKSKRALAQDEQAFPVARAFKKRLRRLLPFGV